MATGANRVLFSHARLHSNASDNAQSLGAPPVIPLTFFTHENTSGSSLATTAANVPFQPTMGLRSSPAPAAKPTNTLSRLFSRTGSHESLRRLQVRTDVDPPLLLPPEFPRAGLLDQGNRLPLDARSFRSSVEETRSELPKKSSERKHRARRLFTRNYTPHTVKDHNNQQLLSSSSQSHSNIKLYSDEFHPAVFNPLAAANAPEGQAQRVISQMEGLVPDSPSFHDRVAQVGDPEQLADDITALMYSLVGPVFSRAETGLGPGSLRRGVVGGGSNTPTANATVLSTYPIEDINRWVATHLYLRYATGTSSEQYVEEITGVFNAGLDKWVDVARGYASVSDSPVTPVFQQPGFAWPPNTRSDTTMEATAQGLLENHGESLARMWDQFFHEQFHLMTGVLLPLQLEFDHCGPIQIPASYWAGLETRYGSRSTSVVALASFRDHVLLKLFEQNAGLPQTSGLAGGTAHTTPEHMATTLALLQCMGTLSMVRSGDWRERAVEVLGDAVRLRLMQGAA